MSTPLRTVPAIITEWDDAQYRVKIHILEEVNYLLGPRSHWKQGCAAETITTLAEIEYEDGLIHTVNQFQLKELKPQYWPPVESTIKEDQYGWPIE
jgi:hypothetical protein